MGILNSRNRREACKHLDDVLLLSPLPVDTAVPSISLSFLLELLSLLVADLSGSTLNGFAILKASKTKIRLTIIISTGSSVQGKYEHKSFRHQK
jgi:hypothetical protein